MAKDFDWQRDYFHKDYGYGQDDWAPAVAFVRGILENTEDKRCFIRTREYILANNSLLSQSLVQQLGFVREERGIEIIEAKLAQLTENDMATASPWCEKDKYLELVCLEALAKIGGPKARGIIEKHRSDPAKSYLADDIDKLDIAENMRPCVAPRPSDFPEELKKLRTIGEIIVPMCGQPKYNARERAMFLKAFQSLKWPGPIEYLSGDGQTSTFEMKNKVFDHIHDFSDPFSDLGIFLSNPKVEYPIGRRRFADSHSFLSYQVVDGDFYGHEYTWNVQDNTITTHFHQHVPLEEVSLNADGKSVTVSQLPISTGVETRGNVFSKQCTSAVHGVWDNPQKQGKNYYVHRANVMTPYKKLAYFQPLHTPVVNQYGIWLVDESEHPERFFDTDGNCIDIESVIEELLIPLHEPKVMSWTFAQYEPTGTNDRFAGRIAKKMWPDLAPVPPASILDSVMGVHFEVGCCGHAAMQQGTHNGYKHGLDINSDGVIDEQDREILQKHVGQVYRMNIGTWGYFGANWISLGTHSRVQQLAKEADPSIYICSYDYGAGYDPDSGCINLFESPPAGKKLYVEYHYDAPPALGEDNVKVYLHRPI